MMLAKTKPSSDDKSLEKPVETTNDREKEIERRLEMLGNFSAIKKGRQQAEDAQEDDLLVLEDEPLQLPIMTPGDPAGVVSPATAPASLVAPASTPPVQDQSGPAPVAKANNKNALLARIMAAQERAKQAQQKQMTAPEPTSAQAENDKMMEALSGLTQPQQTKTKELNVAVVPPLVAVPPPSFDIFEKQMLELPTQKRPVQPAAAPPAFNDISLDVFSQGQVPSAPPVEASAPAAAPDLIANDWNGLMPLAPPTQQTSEPPATDSGEGIFDNDMEGNTMSPDEKHKMVEEQRAIMEQIKKDAANNKASEAAIRADAFQSRMAGNRETAASGVDGFSVSEVEEQRRILEAIERSKMEQVQMSPEEITQMDEDRKLAESLQMEEHQVDVDSEYPGNRRTVGGAEEAEKGWWDTISDAIGLGEETTTTTSRPPESLSQSDGVLHHVSRGDERPERVGLLNLDDDNGNGNGMPAARVAQSKPLFSCVVDSISNTASALSTGIMGAEEEVHGVDTTSFLSVPSVGRGRENNNGSGSYHAIPEHE